MKLQDVLDCKAEWQDYENKIRDFSILVWHQRRTNENGEERKVAKWMRPTPGTFRYIEVVLDGIITAHFEEWYSGDTDYNEIVFPFSYIEDSEWQAKDLAAEKERIRIIREAQKKADDERNAKIKDVQEKTEREMLAKLKEKYEK